MGNKLTFGQLNQIAIRTTVVEVPEFGTDDEGRPFEIVVHGLTVRDRAILSSYLTNFGLREESLSCVIVALASRDDVNGDLVFGESRAAAVDTVSNLHSHYMEAISRLSQVAIELTSDSGDLTTIVNDEKGVVEAEKN